MIVKKNTEHLVTIQDLYVISVNKINRKGLSNFSIFGKKNDLLLNVLNKVYHSLYKYHFVIGIFSSIHNSLVYSPYADLSYLLFVKDIINSIEKLTCVSKKLTVVLVNDKGDDVIDMEDIRNSDFIILTVRAGVNVIYTETYGDIPFEKMLDFYNTI